MTFEFTLDYDLVRELLTIPSCYRRMADDSAPPPELLDVGPLKGVRHVLAWDRGAPVALFVLVDRGRYAEVHFCFRPSVWGCTLEIARLFLHWVWRHTPYERLEGPVPGHNRLALRLAIAAGFRRVGEMKDSIRKDRKVYDLNLLEITRPHE